MKPRPFISYAHEDSDIATRLYADLRELGAEPWLDKKDLLAGQNWQDAIRKAIRECSHFIALISTSSVNKRGYVQKELRLALEILEEFPPSEIFVIPVRRHEVQPSHEALTRIHWVDLFPSYEEGLRALAKSLALADRGDEGKTSFRRAASVGLVLTGGLLLATPFLNKATTESPTTSSSSLTAATVRPSDETHGSSESTSQTNVPHLTSREVVAPPAPAPVAIQKRDGPLPQDSDFQLPSRLEPELADGYWSRELQSSIRGHGRITPELHKRQLQAADATTRGDWQEAQELWEAAVTLSSCCGDYLNYNLAVARANNGDWTGAIEPLKKRAASGTSTAQGTRWGLSMLVSGAGRMPQRSCGASAHTVATLRARAHYWRT